MPGRTGRGVFDRGRYGPQPKYLSLKPPTLRYSCPNLTNNPFYLLGRNLYNGEKCVFTPISSASNVSDASLEDGASSALSNGWNFNNGFSTASSVQNPQDSQHHKNSSRNVFLQFYARRKKSKFHKNKKLQDKLNKSSHSLRAPSKVNPASSSLNCPLPPTMSEPNHNQTDANAMQCFLHKYLRFQAPISKLRHSQDASDMDVDETPFEVPPNDSVITLFAALALHMRKKLTIYYQLYDDSSKSDAVSTMTDDAVADALYNANIALMNKTNEKKQICDNNMQDADSEFGNPLSTPASGDTQRTSTHDRNTASMSNPILDKNTSTNVGLFTSTVKNAPDLTLTQNPSPGAALDSQRKTKALEKTTITCRFRIRVQQNMCHVPYIARQVAQQVKKADQGMTILPFDEEHSANNVLDSPDLLPDNEELLKVWVANAYTYRENINFSMKFSVLKTFKAITNALFPWMSKNNSFVKMDKIKAEKIVTVGFFTNFHPDYHNRDDFKTFCKQHVVNVTDTKLQDEISVYARSVYAGAGIHKVTSRVCVIECAVNEAQIIAEAFADVLPDPYSNITFVPFTKVDDSYNSMLRAALIEQNGFLNSMRRLVVNGLINISLPIATKELEAITPQQWILQVQYENVSIITAVERHSTTATNIIYDVQYENRVHELFNGFNSALKANFDDFVIAKFYSDAEQSLPKKARAVSAREQTYMEALKRRYGNPQDGAINHLTPPPQRRKTMTYGDAVKTPAMSAHPDFETDHTSPSLDARLRAIEEKLQGPSADGDSHSQDSTVPTSIQNLIQTSVDTLGTTLRGEMNQMITNNNVQLANDLMVKFQAMIMATLNPGSTGTPVTQEGAGKN